MEACQLSFLPPNEIAGFIFGTVGFHYAVLLALEHEERKGGALTVSSTMWSIYRSLPPSRWDDFLYVDKGTASALF